MFGRLKIGPAAYSNGMDNIVPRGSREGAVVAANMGPKYLEMVRDDRVFAYTILSQALILTATTGGHPTIINPAGSGRLFVPLALRVAWISTAYTAGALAWAVTRNAGVGAATAGAILTATLVAQVSAKVSANTGNNSKMLWSPTTNTFTAAPVVTFAAGIGHVLTAVDTADYATYDGEIVIAPGNSISLVYTVTTMTALVSTTIWGYEPDE